MPTPVNPDTYVEESSVLPPTIGAISTDRAAFVGPTRKGPIGKRPVLLTSVAQFEQSYGTRADLAMAAPAEQRVNHIAHAVRAYFDNGGTELYVARTALNPGRTPPTPADYAAALATLQPLEEVSTIAAPGYSLRHATDPAGLTAIQGQLLAFAEQAGTYRFAVLDPPPGLTVSEVREFRNKVDSSHAALYYPWLTVANPRALVPKQPATLTLPPSGFLCGIYAAMDHQRGSAKAPANIALQGALAPESILAKFQQEVLNPAGINCLRVLEGRGFLVWGARTLSSDPQWKYLTVRRYLNYLEGSIERGTQWAAFEPNAEPLWARLCGAIGDFLLSEWRNGALLGGKPEEAFFVKCDRSTMTQNDLDQGRLVCLVGVAAVRPAEFVIFRIEQKTT